MDSVLCPTIAIAVERGTPARSRLRTATVIGNTVSGRSTSTTTGGYSVDKPWAEYEAVVFDVVSGQTVWIASMKSGGNAFADWGDLARSMAKTTSERLWNDGVVRRH